MACIKQKCKPAIAPGEMRTEVTVERLHLTDDSKGGQNKVWTNVGTMWCEVKMVNGRETYADIQLREEADHTMRTRWGTVVTLQLKVKDRLRMPDPLDAANPYIFNIRSIDNVDYANTVALIQAERGVPT